MHMLLTYKIPPNTIPDPKYISYCLHYQPFTISYDFVTVYMYKVATMCYNVGKNNKP